MPDHGGPAPGGGVHTCAVHTDTRFGVHGDKTVA
jgi:hypothetical protein